MEGGKKVEERTEKERRMKREWRKTKKGKTNERTQHGESNIGDLKGLCNEIFVRSGLKTTCFKRIHCKK